MHHTVLVAGLVHDPGDHPGTPTRSVMSPRSRHRPGRVHVVKLGSATADEVRLGSRRTPSDTAKGDPLYGIRRILQIGAKQPTDKETAGLDAKLVLETPTRKSPSLGSEVKSSATSITPLQPGDVNS